MMSESKESDSRKYINYFIKAAIVVIILWSCSFLFFLIFKNHQDRGIFGDMFGAVNALFSGLAFAGIIITLIMQKEELESQKAELQLTREEFKTQNETLKIQRFEVTFFNLFDNWKKSFKDIYGLVDSSKREGYTFFRYYAIVLKNFCSTRIEKQNLETVINVYNEGVRAHIKENNFDTYFGALQHLFNYVYYSEEGIEKAIYYRLIKVNLSKYELFILFYKALGNERFKEIFENYSFFENLDHSILINDGHTGLYYGPNSYGKNIDKF